MGKLRIAKKWDYYWVQLYSLNPCKNSRKECIWDPVSWTEGDNSVKGVFYSTTGKNLYHYVHES